MWTLIACSAVWLNAQGQALARVWTGWPGAASLSGWELAQAQVLGQA